MTHAEFLILSYPGISERIEGLFQDLDTSEALRALYVRDPVGVLYSRIFSEDSPAASQLNQGNRLLFSLLTNKNFAAWAQKFGSEIIKPIEKDLGGSYADDREKLALHLSTLDYEEIYRKIADAVLDHADRELIYSLVVSNKQSATTVRRGVPPYGPGRAGDLGVPPTPIFIPVDVWAVLGICTYIHVFHDVVKISLSTVSREDLRRISNIVTDQLLRRGEELRSSGRLMSEEATRLGAKL